MSDPGVPRHSVLGMLTAEGRLRNQWARAHADAAAGQGLDGYRQVQRVLARSPERTAHLWTGFLDDYLGSGRGRSLSEADLVAIEAMASALETTPGAPVQPAEVWRRALAVRDERHEDRQAKALLTRMYRAKGATEPLKAECAAALARRNARGDEHLAIYIERLSRRPLADGRGQPGADSDSPGLSAMRVALESVMAVGFDADRLHLKRAAEIARLLKDARISFRGANTALGLYSLLVEGVPTKAAPLFEAAFHEDRSDQTALTGLLASWLRNGDFVRTSTMAHSAGQTNDVVRALVRLSEALAWLDGRQAPATPPCSAAELEKLGVEQYAGDALAMAVGRLYLIEGDARRACAILDPLTERWSTQPRWGYYAMWAAMLSPDLPMIAPPPVVARWRGAWTVASLWLEADRERAEGGGALDLLAHASARSSGLRDAASPSAPVYAACARARAALLEGRPATCPDWRPGSAAATVEEDLEALRTVLGVSFHARDPVGMQRALELPLLGRLPLADQVAWRGLHALLTPDSMQVEALLTRAGASLGSRRALVALTVYLLGQSRIGQARAHLERLTCSRPDPTTALLGAYIDACEGRVDAAAEVLRRQSGRHAGRASYVLGHLYQQSAAKARRPADREAFRKQSAAAFAAALVTGQVAPADTSALAQVSEVMAHPERAPEHPTSLWKDAGQVARARRAPWMEWVASLASLRYGNPAEARHAAEAAFGVLQETPNAPTRSYSTLADCLASACLRMKQAEAAPLRDILARMAAVRPSEAARGCQLAAAAEAQAQRPAPGAPRSSAEPDAQNAEVERRIARLVATAPGNPIMALILADVRLQADRPEDARAALSSAGMGDDWVHALCNSLAALVGRTGLSIEFPALAPAGTRPEAQLACSLASAAAAFASGSPDKGFECMLTALRQDPSAVVAVVDAGRFLPALCAQARARGAPDILRELVRGVAASAADSADAGTIARCAAAIGEVDVALRLWSDAVTGHDGRTDGLAEELLKYLCHLALTAHSKRDLLSASRYLRRAAVLAAPPHPSRASRASSSS